MTMSYHNAKLFYLHKFIARKWRNEIYEALEFIKFIFMKIASENLLIKISVILYGTNIIYNTV